MYLIPLVLVLKLFFNVSDKFIYDSLISGCEDKEYYKNCVLNMLRSVHEETKMHTHEQCKAYIGKIFKIKFYELPSSLKDQEVCDYIVKNCLAIHLDDNEDKFNLFCFMTKKLFSFVEGKSLVEGVDGIMMQECLLGGHLYLQIIKEKLYSWLMLLRLIILRRAKAVATNKYNLNAREYIYLFSWFTIIFFIKCLLKEIKNFLQRK